MERCQPFWDHHPILVTTRGASAQEGTTYAEVELQYKGCEVIPDGLEDAFLDERLDEALDGFDVELAREGDLP